MFKSWPVFAIGLAVIIFSAAARADGGVEDILSKIDNPAGLSSTDSQAPLRLTSNKNEIIRLDQDAANVIVNNPDHATVMLDSPRLLIIMPRLPGTTSFTVLDSNGKTILQKDIIVSNVQKKYVRIRRICAGNDSSCTASAYYYCPDGCYEVTPVAPNGSGTISVPPPVAAANTAAGLAGDQNSGEGAPASNPVQQGGPAAPGRLSP